MKEYKEKSSFQHLDIIGDVYLGLLSGLAIFVVSFSVSNPNNVVKEPNWVEAFVLFNSILIVFMVKLRSRQYLQWDKTIWIDNDNQTVEVEFYKGAFLRYNYRKIPFRDLDIKLPRLRVGPKPSNRMIYEIRIFDKGEIVTSCNFDDKWTNGGFDELLAEFTSIKEAYCDKEQNSSSVKS